tara:strand:+ start:912 stop:2489 length:1578 start_codon:yes stop_codon:yes gene_type:complete
MVLPLLGAIAKGAIKGIVSRKRRKKGEGAQVSTSIVKVNKNKKSSALVKPATPIFGGSKEVSETSSSIQSSSIIESLDKIDKSIANIKTIIVSESKFKSKVGADNLKKQNLLMKRKKEKEFKSKKTSMSVTGRSISKMGSFLSRFLPFIVATLLGSVVLSIYKGLGAIIKFFQNIFNALNGFFAALDPFIRPILNFFNLFRKQDTGDLDPKIGETEEEEVNKLEEQVKDLDKQADVFVKEFNKQKEEFLKVSTQYQKTVQVAVDKINKDILYAQENTPQDTEEIASVDVSITDDTTAADISSDTTADTTAADISSDTTADTLEVNPTVSMVNNNMIPDKSNQESDVKPTTSLVPNKEKDTRFKGFNNISKIDKDKLLLEREEVRNRAIERGDIKLAEMKERQQKYKDEGDYEKVAGVDRKIKFQDHLLKVLKGERSGNVSIKEPGSKNTFKFYGDKPKILQSEGISDQVFYETNQTKTNIVFIKDPQVSSSGGGGGGFILPVGPSKSEIVNSKREEDLKSALYSA